MITIPFIYFTLLLLRQLHKNKWHFDVACFILSIFALSGFFSILIDIFDIRSIDTSTYKISPMATFTYCGLITLCTWPFMSNSNLKIRKLEPIKNDVLLKAFAIAFFLFFLINFVFSLDNIMAVITSDDMIQIRADHYAGYDKETWMSKLPFYARMFFFPFRLFSACSWIFVFLAFYSSAIQKLSRSYSLLYLLASVNGIIENINIGGRSAMTFWMLGAIACFLFFRPYMEKNQKRMYYKLILIIAILFGLYLSAMTISRFEERNFGDVGGAEGSLVSYMGQSFINFCYYFDTFDCPAPTLQIIFPLAYQLVGYPIQGAGAVQELLSMMTGKQIGVFYTFIGQIIVSSYNIVGVLYCVFLFVISMNVSRRVKNRFINLKQAFLYLACSSVLFLGIFGHYYSYSAKTASLLFWLFVFSSLKTSNTQIETSIKSN